MTRFKKGSRVEVLSKTDLPSGLRRCGEIILGNGHTYWVRYDGGQGLSDQDNVDRVSRKYIRPCPPPADALDGWTVGDVVEVLDDLSWKTAAILKVLGGDYYLVRLNGSLRELILNKVNIRVHQLRQHGKHGVVGTGPGSWEDRESDKPCSMTCYQKMHSPMLQANKRMKVQAGENYLTIENNTSFLEPRMVSARTSKWDAPFRSSDFEAYNKKINKLKAAEKRGKDQRVIAGYPSSFLKKVDAVAYPQECLGELYMHASPTIQTTGPYELERGPPNYFVNSFSGRSLEPNDSDSDACSVGSCSVTSSSPLKLFSRIAAGNSPNANTLCNDAESLYGHGDEEENCSLPFGEEAAARIHRLELHAYRCTLGAFYASGSLSWEQEALLTNLRISLNISDDEHLMELRILTSASTSVHIC